MLGSERTTLKYILFTKEIQQTADPNSLRIQRSELYPETARESRC